MPRSEGQGWRELEDSGNDNKSLTCTGKFSIADKMLTLMRPTQLCGTGAEDWGKAGPRSSSGKPATDLCK